MKTAILAAALCLPFAASAQVLIETKAERAERCATMTPAIDAAEKLADARIAAADDAIARTRAGDVSAATIYHRQNGDVLRALDGIAGACNVAAPVIGNRAEGIAQRVRDSSMRVLDVATDVALGRQ